MKLTGIRTAIYWWIGSFIVLNCALLAIDITDVYLGEFTRYLYSLCYTMLLFHIFNLATGKYSITDASHSKCTAPMLSRMILPWAWVQVVSFFAIGVTIFLGNDIAYSATLWAGLAYNIVLIGIIASKRFCR